MTPSRDTLILWSKDGRCAQFCDHCQAAWWGIKTFDEVEPRPKPEAGSRRR